MRALIAVLIFFVVNSSRAAEAIITDGDTLILNGSPYRLDGVDAPETDQVCLDAAGAVWTCGIEARDQLKNFVGKRDVRCESKQYDTVYRNRRIGICRIEGVATTLNEWLVREGWALNFEPYAKGRFKAAEEDARKEGRGLWRGCFSAPQAQRRGTKKEAKLLGSACTSGMDKEVRDMLFPAHPAMPPGCLIKGKIAARAQVTGHRGIYHMAGCRSYARTKTPYRWFCSEDEAQAEGFRKAFTCSNAR
jgi:endonuclease YncB( thermonuclease family)